MTENKTLPNLEEAFFRTYERKANFIARAPGRVNLIGEHTDYNEGLVMPMAINRKIEIAFAPRGDSIVNLFSINFGHAHQFNLQSKLVADECDWANYVKAVASILLDSDYSLSGVDAVVYGDIPIASGLSSSAAIEVASALALLTAAKIELPQPLEIAKIAQQAERDFIGVKCGLMDQFISAAAITSSALQIDCHSMEFDQIQIPSNLSIIVADTRLSRKLAGSAYNERCRECAQAFQIVKQNLKDTFSLDSVKEIDSEILAAGKPFLSETLYRRIKHVVTENGRVELAAEALRRSDFNSLGKYFNESHESLRLDYEVSSPALDRAVNQLRQLPGSFGARLTGAGFGGCAIAAVDSSLLEEFMLESENAFRDWEPKPELFCAIPSNGGSVIRL